MFNTPDALGVVMVEREELGGPTVDEIASCTRVLLSITQDDLDQPSCAELVAAGTALFKRRIMKAAFGTEDVVAFMKKKSGYSNTLAELKTLRAKIRADHEAARLEAETCGINAERKETLAAIVAECAEADGTLRLTSVEASPHEERSLLQHARTQHEHGQQQQQQQEQQRQSQEEAGREAEAEAEAEAGAGAEAEADKAVAEAKLPLPGDFRLVCNMCRGRYLERHHFYHHLVSYP